VKKIGFITKNKVLAQSLASLIKSNRDIPFEPYLMLNLEQAAIDAEVFKIDIAVVELAEEATSETGVVISLCKELRKASPGCQILLLVPQDIKRSRDEAMKAINDNIIDDYVFLDTSLDYLLAKLLAL